MVLEYFHNDTYPDIAVTKEGVDSALLLHGFDKWTFGRSQDFPGAHDTDPCSVAMSDLNNDLQLDRVMDWG